VQNREASVYLNSKKEGAIIISASGMMSGGRILHHLYHRLPRPNDTLLIVGYQAAGTRGRKILNGDLSVRIFGELVSVKCHVEEVNGLSAHADKTEVMEWLEGFTQKPKMTFVVHGEPESADYLRSNIAHTFGWNVFTPEYLENYELFDGI
jgi:metallo-beta-lactamase family protein